MKKGFSIMIALVVALLLLELVFRLIAPDSKVFVSEHLRLRASCSRVVNIAHAPNELAEAIHYSTDEQGFRANTTDNNAANPGSRYPIYCVGAEAVFCPLLDDAQAWPAMLHKRLNTSPGNVWVANAGLEAASASDHLLQIEEQLPDGPAGLVMLLCGLNDMEGSPLLQESHLHAQKGLFPGQRLLERSALMRYLLHLGAPEPIQIDFASQQQLLAARAAECKWADKIEHLPAFRQQVMQLLAAVRNKGHEVVFITQPLPEAWDSERWQAMELYNEILREVAITQSTKLIDLGRQLPKNNKWFVDARHLSPEGSAEIARILGAQLHGWLSAKK